MSTPIITTISITGIPKFITGKVRDVFDLGDSLLMVASDRISAFDVVLPNGVPNKGKVLTQMSLFWFNLLKDVTENHVISSDTNVIMDALVAAGAQDVDEKLGEQLDGRSLLVQKCTAFPIECVVRGYLAGSAWKDYQKLFSHGGEVNLYGIPVQVGLRESEKLDEPIFTPATKAVSGHDENISVAEAEHIVGQSDFQELRELSKAIYAQASSYAAERGIIIADTKFEFGRTSSGKIILIDEVLTPDSSRFWDSAVYRPGKPQPSFDKQFVRDFLETLDWDKTAPGPKLPDDVVSKTAEKYSDAYHLITGSEMTV